MKKIHTANNITEAHIIKGLLESSGIETYVGGHYLQGGIGELPATDTASIHVHDEQVDEAKKIIQQYENNTDRTASSSSKDAELWLIAPLIVVGICILYAVFSLLNE